MAKKRISQIRPILPDIPEQIITVKDVNFPGDAEGNQLARIEAELKDINREMIDGLIITTTDRLKLQLSAYQNWLRSKNDWIGWAGVIITIVLALITSDFKDIWLSSDSWKLLFFLALLASVGWLIYLLCKFFKTKKEQGNIDNLVDKIKRRELK